MPEPLRCAEYPALSAEVLDFRLGERNAEPVCEALNWREVPFIFFTGLPGSTAQWPRDSTCKPVLSEEDVRCADNGRLYIGPDGETTRLDQLPRCDLKRWRPRHNAMVVAAVRHGLITINEACAGYDLSIEEYLSWYQCYTPQPSNGWA
jgi:hypothetical protein